MVLVDEYDKPILNTLGTPDVALANRDYPRGLYGMIESNDAHVRFTFLTGVSKFRKVSIFYRLEQPRATCSWSSATTLATSPP